MNAVKKVLKVREMTALLFLAALFVVDHQPRVPGRQQERGQLL